MIAFLESIIVIAKAIPVVKSMFDQLMNLWVKHGDNQTAAYFDKLARERGYATHELNNAETDPEIRDAFRRLVDASRSE